MATNSIQPITKAPDVGQTVSAQASSGGVVASKASASVKPAAKPADANASDSASSNNPTHSADLRLEIEDDKAAGCFVYKIINRTTGEVVEQIPQEQIVKLRESDGYLAGDLIKAQA
ncbi:flagellar protein FlaG [Phenylobacterium montanum]|uniref:Flagellar protein FlaG n=1 Tax=Phenylobacterium montanum TaxID=2823693 RepID=A0A975G044_9CAUL|nr:flagellar protein FlaG [Caulobacter sp. S6]QUD88102.1 flagellar protein FlaG [Caulobacter sp. S6]